MTAVTDIVLSATLLLIVFLVEVAWIYYQLNEPERYYRKKIKDLYNRRR